MMNNKMGVKLKMSVSLCIIFVLCILLTHLPSIFCLRFSEDDATKNREMTRQQYPERWRELEKKCESSWYEEWAVCFGYPHTSLPVTPTNDHECKTWKLVREFCRRELECDRIMAYYAILDEEEENSEEW